MYGYSQFRVRGEAHLLASSFTRWNIRAYTLLPGRAPCLFCIYYITLQITWSTHPSNVLFRPVPEGNNLFFIYLLINTLE